ncbi:MAG: hypothetical protein AAB305_07490 [Candidatus Zixiibacteriota bacterium]
MRFTKKLFCLLVCIVTSTHSAEEHGFSIQDYVPDKYKDAVWLVSGDMSAYGTNSGGNSHNSFPTLSTSKSDGSYSYSHLTFASRFDLLSLSRRSWWSFSGDLSGGLNRSSSTSSWKNFRTVDSGFTERSADRDVSTSYSTVGLNGRLEFGRYFWRSFSYNMAVRAGLNLNRNNYEWNSSEESISIVYSYRVDSVTLLQTSDGGGMGNNASVTSTVGLSAGYLYEGRYSASVLHLLRELKKRGLLNKQPTSEQIRVLCDTAYAYANRYFADKRWKRTATSRALAETLVNLGLLQSPNGPMLIWMQDIWYGYSRESRRFGTRLTIGINAVGQSSHTKSHVNTTQDQESRNYYPQFGDSLVIEHFHSKQSESRTFEYQSIEYYNTISAAVEKPLSLRWQFRASISGQTRVGGYVWNDNEPRKDLDNWYSPNIISMSASVAFIADSRTTASAAGYVRSFDAHEANVLDYQSYRKITARDYKLRVMALSGNLSYWTSDNTQVVGRCGVERKVQRFKEGRNSVVWSTTSMILSLNVSHFII